MRKKIKLSVVIPAYNEEKNIKFLHEKLLAVLKKINIEYEIIFIDDGSTDNTFKKINKLYTLNRNVKCFRLRRNFGKSTALAIGFKQAVGELIFTMDADLQDQPDQIPKFLKKAHLGYDLVCGWRYQRKDRFFKKLSSYIFNYVTAFVTRTYLHDINCGFKLLRREVAQNLKINGELHRFIPVIARWQGFKIGEIKIEHSPRRFGKSKYNLTKHFSGFFDLLTVMFLTRYLSKPLHVFGMVGLLSFFLGGSVIGLLEMRKFFFGIIIGPGRPLVQISVFLMIFGVQVFIFGLLAEIIIYGQNQKEPNLIKEKF